MTQIALPNRPSGTAPRAIADILANFDAVVTVVNGQLGADNLQQALLDLLAPVGSGKVFFGTAAPTGYILCDGSSQLRATYPRLWTFAAAEIAAGDTLWTNGDGATTFTVPDLRGRVPVGAGTGAGLTARALGANGGEETHTLGQSEIPRLDILDENNNVVHLPHATGGNASSINVATGLGYNGGFLAAGAAGGGGGAHNNMQPYRVVNWIVRHGS